jgi:hypothetical protein
MITRFRKFDVCALLLLSVFLSLPTLAVTLKETLLQAFTLEKNAPRKKVSVKIEYAGKLTVQEWTVVNPDRLHFVQEIGSEKQELYVIGKRMYVKGPSGWSMMKASFVPNPPILNLLQAAAVNSISNVSLVGSEILESEQTNRYQAQLDFSDSRISFRGTANAWIGQSTGLPIRLAFDGRLGTEVYRLSATIEYDPATRINPPI